jgi:hypothetical protein
VKNWTISKWNIDMKEGLNGKGVDRTVLKSLRCLSVQIVCEPVILRPRKKTSFSCYFLIKNCSIAFPRYGFDILQMLTLSIAPFSRNGSVSHSKCFMKT